MSSSILPPAPASAPAPAKTTKPGKDTSKAPPKKKSRRKKPSVSSKGPNSAALLAAAKISQAELNSMKALEAARRKDPLWYRSSEVLQAISADSTPVPGLLNEQVDLVENALRNNFLSRADVTPQAFGVLLEQARRYALELVADAQDCAYAAHRHDITRADLVIALELRPDQPNTSTLTELQKMNHFAHNINKKPLPPIPQQCYSGILLPPKANQLTARTFDVLTGAQVMKKMNQPLPTAPNSKRSGNDSINTSKKKATNSTPSYGASRGPQIPININSSIQLPSGDKAKDEEKKSGEAPTTSSTATAAVAGGDS
mmetsp:Transcript_27976/g.41318  ORF Transcript_27976/g.41318 Transcript_27976/m.41318 type:complete len:315 (+) Transcript_27976:173-1117(+)